MVKKWERKNSTHGNQPEHLFMTANKLKSIFISLDIYYLKLLSFFFQFKNWTD